MKRNEIALILVIVGLVVISTYALLNAVIGGSALKPVGIKTTNELSTSLSQPSPAVFNKDAINPAVSVTIGNQSAQDQQPFTIGE